MLPKWGDARYFGGRALRGQKQGNVGQDKAHARWNNEERERRRGCAAVACASFGHLSDERRLHRALRNTQCGECGHDCADIPHERQSGAHPCSRSKGADQGLVVPLLEICSIICVTLHSRNLARTWAHGHVHVHRHVPRDIRVQTCIQTVWLRCTIAFMAIDMQHHRSRVKTNMLDQECYNNI